MKAKWIAFWLGLGALAVTFWYIFMTGDEAGGNKSVTRKKIKIKKAKVDDLTQKAKVLEDKIVHGKVDAKVARENIATLEVEREKAVTEIKDMTDEDLAKELGSLLGDLL